MERLTLGMCLRGLATAAAAILGAVCCGGELMPTPTECPEECLAGTVCRDGSCVSLSGSCEEVECPPGQSCDDGVCIPDDACAGVVCPNPGEICSGGVCVSGESDSDGDGVLARDDCDDSDSTIYPGAPELCTGVDNDCDPTTADGAADCPDLCCGEPSACRECCLAADCGRGGWSCEAFLCGCDGVITDDACAAGGLCIPGEEEVERNDCARCGRESRSRTCSDLGEWGSWSSWGDCNDQGECEDGATGATTTHACGTCLNGTRHQTWRCNSSCTWVAEWDDECSGNYSCSDRLGAIVCPGDIGIRVCPSDPLMIQQCICSTTGSWISCDACR